MSARKDHYLNQLEADVRRASHRRRVFYDGLAGPEIQIFHQLAFVREGGVLYVRLLLSDAATRRRDL